MGGDRDRLQIGEFADLVGLSIPQLRRYDRLQLLAPAGRSESGYRYYSRGQTGAARVIALLRSMDMPLADVRRILSGAGDDERRQLFRDHRARLASGEIEVLLLVPGTADAPPPAQSAYVYVEDPDSLCAEYQQAGADVVEPVASRPDGMRDFVVRDLDGHRFTLGRGEEALREVADQYGLTADEIAVDPPWLDRRK